MDTQTEETAEDRNTRRISIGTPDSGPKHVVGKTRRYSIAITSSQKSTRDQGNNTLPNYLRASTGSCHDFCKYGKKHEQSNSASPIKFKRTTIINKEKVTKTVVPVERKKTTMVAKPIEAIIRDVSLPSKKVEISKRVLSKVTENELKVSSHVKPKPVIVKPSLSASDSSNGRVKKKNVGTVKKTGMTVKKVVTNDTPTESLSPKASFNRVLSLKARKNKNPKPVSPLKDKNRMQKTDQLKEPISDKVQIKTLQDVEAESEHINLESVLTAIEIIQSHIPPLMESIDSPVSDSFQSSDNKKVLELESSIAPPVSESSQSCYDEEVLEEEFEYSTDDEKVFVSENDDELETSVGNHDKIPRKGRMVISEGKDDKAIKLRFRRGKILDLQNENNNGPRRLKFRKGRVVEGDQDGQRIVRRNFKNKYVDQETMDSDSKNGPESVVLKHQGEQEKKDAQGLFNNVIEETASKLVESRKSKVKALVGAFETVISLQDGKPSSS